MDGQSTDYSIEALAALRRAGYRPQFLGNHLSDLPGQLNIDTSNSLDVDSDAVTDANELRLQQLERMMRQLMESSAPREGSNAAETSSGPTQQQAEGESGGASGPAMAPASSGTGVSLELGPQGGSSTSLPDTASAVPLAVTATWNSTFDRSTKLDQSVSAACLSGLALSGSDLKSIKARSIKEKLKYAGACETIVTVCDGAATYGRTAGKRSKFLVEGATAELVFDLSFGATRSSLKNIMIDISGVSSFNRSCFVKSAAVTSIVGACALGDFLLDAQEEYDYLVGRGLWDKPVMQEAYFTVLNRNFACYGALLRGVRAESSFSRVGVFASDMDYKLTVVAVESGFGGHRAEPSDGRPGGGADSAADNQRVYEGYTFYVDNGLPKIYGLSVKIGDETKNVSWGLAAGLNSTRLRKMRRGIRSFKGIARSDYEAAVDALGEFKLKAYATALEKKGITGGTKAWLMANYDKKTE